MIRTETRQYWGESNYTYTFNVPSFSQVKKIYLLDNYLYMIIEYLEEFSLDTSKIINLKVQSQITPVEDSFYKYFDTQIDIFNQEMKKRGIYTPEQSYRDYTKIEWLKPHRGIGIPKPVSVCSNGYFMKGWTK